MLKIENDPTAKKLTILRPWKEVVVFAVGLIGLILLSFLIELIMSAIAKASSPTQYDYEVFINSTLASMILNGSAYLILGVFFIIFLRKDSDELFKSFKDWRPYIAALIGFSAIIAFNVTYNIILTTAGVGISDNANETSLNSIVTDFPLSSLLLFGLIGPLCEELAYRVGLFTLVRRVNRILAYFVTMIVFTLIHFDFFSTTMVNELLNIPLYFFAAFVFTFLYEKYGLASSLSAHITNNLVSLITTILSIIRI